MIQHETLTNSDKSKLVDATGSQAAGSRTIEEDLGTMVIIFWHIKYISLIVGSEYSELPNKQAD